MLEHNGEVASEPVTGIPQAICQVVAFDLSLPRPSSTEVNDVFEHGFLSFLHRGSKPLGWNFASFTFDKDRSIPLEPGEAIPGALLVNVVVGEAGSKAASLPFSSEFVKRACLERERFHCLLSFLHRGTEPLGSP
jgi:hypothetical protein